MDRAYAELSLFVGWVAAAADDHLGGLYFLTKSRAMRWDLTPEWFEELKQEALAKGVPEAIVRSSPFDEYRAQIEAFFKLHEIITSVDQNRNIDSD